MVPASTTPLAVTLNKPLHLSTLCLWVSLYAENERSLFHDAFLACGYSGRVFDEFSVAQLRATPVDRRMWLHYRRHPFRTVWFSESRWMAACYFWGENFSGVVSVAVRQRVLGKRELCKTRTVV